MWLDVDGHRYQNGTTGKMIFGVAYIVHYLSQIMSLQPGDLIATGTPPGVGMGQKPQIYLHAGQRVRLGVEGLGEQEAETIDAE
jgi:2-keto-4-pentenoate hydratase/2-oxohepta-3-ene-1,7-dioic acid hydratase in catechol pathway